MTEVKKYRVVVVRKSDGGRRVMLESATQGMADRYIAQGGTQDGFEIVREEVPRETSPDGPRKLK